MYQFVIWSCEPAMGSSVSGADFYFQLGTSVRCYNRQPEEPVKRDSHSAVSVALE